jgi:membrane-bound lytic murein transglycosylase A
LQLRKLFLLFILLFSISSCTKHIVKPNLPNANCPPVAKTGEVKSQVSEIKPLESAKIADYSLLKISKWEDIDGLEDDDLSAAWPAWQQSCSTLINKTQWQAACSAAKIENKPSNAEVNAYFKNYFDVYSANNADGSNTGLITGYYEPFLKGSRQKSEQYPYPLYRQPNDLITVELGNIYPELKYKRVRGKLVSNKLVPYNTRAEIEANPSPLEGTELLWIDDIIDVFFLQIQGSGLVKLDSGQEIQVGYADQNGHPYNSIGRILIERGELTADQASMQGIKTWARSHIDKLRDLLNSNPSYVFFKELPTGLPGPIGALGVPISAERSLAIDPKFLPLGAPVFLSTTQPNSSVSLKRLMVAQDTGGAIKGGVRADFFWGAGDAAGAKAGAMKQSGKIWVLLPKGFKFSQAN